jgi:hypothetical protein
VGTVVDTIYEFAIESLGNRAKRQAELSQVRDPTGWEVQKDLRLKSLDTSMT